MGWTEHIRPPSRGVHGDVHFQALWTPDATLGPVGLEAGLRARLFLALGNYI